MQQKLICYAHSLVTKLHASFYSYISFYLYFLHTPSLLVLQKHQPQLVSGGLILRWHETKKDFSAEKKETKLVDRIGQKKRLLQEKNIAKNKIESTVEMA